MKSFPLNRLHAAVLTAAGASLIALAPMNANAQNPAAPVGDSATNLGQLATAFYVAQPINGWTTTINITNTSENALAVKVRIKEFKNSRDALDFWVMLSPYDVWAGNLVEDVYNGEPAVLIRTEDNSCTSPVFEQNPNNANVTELPLSTFGFYDANGTIPLAADDGGSTDDAEAFDRLGMGHIEIIAAAECDMVAPYPAGSLCYAPASGINGIPPARDGIGWLTKHVDGTPRNCAKADTYFIARNPTLALPGNPNGNPLAIDPAAGYTPLTDLEPLKVNVAYLRTNTGTGASSQALHFDNVHTANLVTAQNDPFFVEPTFATAPSGVLWNAQNLALLEQRFVWSNSIQEWSVNAANGVQTSIMLNFPTKGYHVDQYCNEYYAGNNSWRFDGATILACANAQDKALLGLVPGTDYSQVQGTGDFSGTRLPAFPPTVNPFPNRWVDGSSDIPFIPVAYDREECSIAVTAPSPGRQGWVMPWEVGLLSFDENGGAFGSLPGEVYVNAPGQLTDFCGYTVENGWINVGFITDANATNAGIPGFVGNVGEFTGLPHHGLMLKTRSLGNAAQSYGQATENGYEFTAFPVPQP